ncbi:hypothetical protein ABPG72_018442 [Tetrahymena utriculariae]
MILQLLVTFFLLFSSAKLECSHNFLEADELHLYSQVQNLDLPNTLVHCDEAIHICFIYSSMNLTLNLYDFFRFEIIESVSIKEKYVKEIHITKYEEQIFIVLESEQNEILVFTFDVQIQQFSTYQKLNENDIQVSPSNSTNTVFQQVNQTLKVESNVRNLREVAKIDKEIEKPFIHLKLLVQNKGLQDKKQFYLIKIRLNLSNTNKKIQQEQDQFQQNNKTIIKYQDIDLSRFEIRPNDSSLHFISCSLYADQSYIICVDNSLKVGFLDLKTLESPVFLKQKNSANKLEISFQLQSIILSKQDSYVIVLIYQSIQKKKVVFDQFVFQPHSSTFTSFSRYVVQNMNQDILISKLFQNQTSLKQNQTQLKNYLFDFNETQFKEKKQNKTNVILKQNDISSLLFSKANSKQISGFFITDGQRIQFYIKNCLQQNEQLFYTIFDCQKSIECCQKRNFNNLEISITEKNKNSGKLQNQKDYQKKQLKLIKRINIRYQASLNLEEFIEQNKSQIIIFLLLLICVGCLCHENIQECFKSQKNKYCKDQSDISQQHGIFDQPQLKKTNPIESELETSIKNEKEYSEYLVIQQRQIADNKNNISNFQSDIENYSVEDLYMDRNYSMKKLEVSKNNYPKFEERFTQINEIIRNAQIQKNCLEQQTQTTAQEDQEEEKQQCQSQLKNIQEYQYKQECNIDKFCQFQKNNQIQKNFQIPAFEIEKDNKNCQNDFLYNLKSPPQNQYKGVSDINSHFSFLSSKQTEEKIQGLNSNQHTDTFNGNLPQYSAPPSLQKNKDSKYFDSQTLKGAFNQEEIYNKNDSLHLENIISSYSAESNIMSFRNDQQFIDQQNILNERDFQFKDKLSHSLLYKNDFEINKFQNQNNQILEQQHQNTLNQIYFQFNDKEFIVPTGEVCNSPCNYQFKQMRQNIYHQDMQQRQDQQYCKTAKTNQLQSQEFISTQSLELRLQQKYQLLSSYTKTSKNSNITPLSTLKPAIPTCSQLLCRSNYGVGVVEGGNLILQDDAQQKRFLFNNSTKKENTQGQIQYCRKSNQKEQKYRLQIKNIQDEKATKQQYLTQQIKKFNQWKEKNEACYLHYYSPHTKKQFKKCVYEKFRQELDWFTQSSFYYLSPHMNSVLQKKINSQNQKISCQCDPQQQIQKINQQKCSFCLYDHNIKSYNQLNHDQKKQNLRKSQFFFNCKNNCNSLTLTTQSNNIHKSASNRLEKKNQTQQKLLKNQVESSQISNNIHSYQSQLSPPSQHTPSTQEREQMWHLTFQQQSVNFEEEILNQIELSGSATSQSNSSILTSDFQSQRFMDNFQEQMGDCVNQESKYDPFFYTSETNDKSFFSSTSNEFGDTVKKIRHINNDLKQQEIFDIKDFQFISESLFEESQEVKKQKEMNHILFNNNLNSSGIFDKNDQIDTLQKMTQQINNHFLLSINNLLNQSKNI